MYSGLVEALKRTFPEVKQTPVAKPPERPKE